MNNAFLLVGFSRIDITPDDSVPLAGYGNTSFRMSQNILDPITFTAIALTDKNDNTVLLCTVDLINVFTDKTKILRENISKATGVKKEQIIIDATHTHSGPDAYTIDMDCMINFYDKYFDLAVECAKSALADRAPATMMIGRTNTNKLNFIRHYFAEDGSPVSDNHDARKSTDIPIVKHATEVNSTMHLIKFVRNGVSGEVCGVSPQDKKDVVLINWRAHGTKTGGGKKYDVSADYPYPLRKFVEQDAGVLCAYFQGEAGNVNPQSRIAEERTDPDYMVYGRQLADVALNGLKDLHEVPQGTIKHSVEKFTYNVNHAFEDIMDIVHETQRIWRETNSSKATKEFCMPYGIFSPYHANAIANRSHLPATSDCELNVMLISNVAFAFAPFEVFDTLGMIIKENSKYTETLVMGYSCESRGYLPSKIAYEYGCYEADCTKMAEGTGEKVAEKLVQMINNIKN